MKHFPPTFVRKPLLCTLAGFLLISALSSAEEKVWFIDTNHIYQKGSALSREYLALNAPEFAEKLHKDIQPWVVRIQVFHSFTEDGHQTNHGTGTILENGIVITAKHVLTANVTAGEDIKILLTTIDGRTFPATLIKKGKTDWAELQMQLTDQQSAMKKSPIQLATPLVGETAVFLGYPAQLGLDKEGNVQSFQSADKKNNIPANSLHPMPIVCSVAAVDELELSPLAGFPAVGGMSGGPVFNLRGEVIAVQKSISVTSNNSTGEVIRYELGGESSDSLELSAK